MVFINFIKILYVVQLQLVIHFLGCIIIHSRGLVQGTSVKYFSMLSILYILRSSRARGVIRCLYNNNHMLQHGRALAGRSQSKIKIVKLLLQRFKFNSAVQEISRTNKQIVKKIQYCLFALSTIDTYLFLYTFSKKLIT